MIVFPCQVGSAFATSGCASKRTAKKTMSALTASASVLGMIVGPIAAASAAKLSGSRVVATDTLDGDAAREVSQDMRGRGPDGDGRADRRRDIDGERAAT